MQQARYAQVKAVFAEVCDLAEPERSARLQQLSDDPAVRELVLALLDQQGADTARFAQPVLQALAAASPAGTPAAAPPEQVGAYRILRLLGSGGFGEVYEAEQQRPLQRRVALKLIKPGMAGSEASARFETERQALARMDHPHIARVFDAGEIDGRPYFVMELVAGEPLGTYCDHHLLPLRARLELFEQVCLAVQHAHARGVLHRDLKPGNVLVATLDDGRPWAKVIDFGIAKALGEALSDTPVQTRQYQLIGTPLYMSPEQVAGEATLDASTDVYALGVVLYELLAGSTPFDAATLRAGGLAGMQRLIREVQPPWPSVRLAQSLRTQPELARQRSAEPARLLRQLRGELDWIVLKAIEKSRERRYRSASALAADLRRHLDGQPISAGAPALAKRLARQLQRWQRPLAASLLLLLALLAGAAWQAQRTTSPRPATPAAGFEAMRPRPQPLLHQPLARLVRERYARSLRYARLNVPPGLAPGQPSAIARALVQGAVPSTAGEPTDSTQPLR